MVWKPDLFPFEAEFFERCPKSVLYMVAMSLAERLNGQASMAGRAPALALLAKEWQALNDNSLVPQPAFLPEAVARLASEV